MFDNPLIYTDHKARFFDNSHTQGLDTVNVQRSYFHAQATIKILEHAPFLNRP